MSGRVEENCEIRQSVQLLSGTDRSWTYRTDSVCSVYSVLIVTCQLHTCRDVETHSDCGTLRSCFVTLFCHEGRRFNSTFLLSAEVT